MNGLMKEGLTNFPIARPVAKQIEPRGTRVGSCLIWKFLMINVRQAQLIVSIYEFQPLAFSVTNFTPRTHLFGSKSSLEFPIFGRTMKGTGNTG